MLKESAAGRVGRIALLSTISLAALATTGALADQTVPAGTTQSNVGLGAGENLTNNGTINNANDTNDPGVGAGSAVGTITNNAGATISATGNGSAIGVNGNIAGVINSGTISANILAVGANGIIAVFRNEASGTITSATDQGVGTNGGFGTFSNAGVLTGQTQGVATSGNITTFSNSGTITGVTDDGVGVYNGAKVTTFSNTKTIIGALNGVKIEGGADSFTNSGAITGTNDQGVEFGANVGTFANTGGTISGGNTGVAFANGSGVTSFSNSGTITGGNNEAVNVQGMAGTFTNSGTLKGARYNAVYFDSGVQSFINAKGGLIQNTDAKSQSGGGSAVGFNVETGVGGTVTSFVNDGTILGATVNLDTNDSGPAVGFFSNGNPANAVGSFVNTGLIKGADTGVMFAGAVTKGSNSGSIISTAASNRAGVYIGAAGSSFTNTGTIEGPTGIGFDNQGVGGVNTFINAGTVRSTGNEPAIGFFGAATNDTVKILTGSEIFGQVDFGNGNDTFDFSEFYGTTVVQVEGLEAANIVAGNRPYAILANNGVAGDTQAGAGIAIYDPTGASSVGTLSTDVVSGIQGAIFDQFGSFGAAGTGGTLVSGYAPERRQTSAAGAAESAVLTLLDTEPVSGGQWWGKLFGGVSADSAPVALSNVYGGIVAGSHFQLNADTLLGGLGGYARSGFVVANGQQTINTDTGVLGVYGNTDLGSFDVTYSLLGGYSNHSSSRRVVAGGAAQTATANFSSWFIAPGLGVSVPVLSATDYEVNVAASASYIFGGVSGYTETIGGGGGTVTVGGQSIGVFDARLELNGLKVVGATEHGDVAVRGKVGVLAQANAGGSAVPISFASGTFTGTTSFTAPGTTAFGVYAGAGLTADIGSGLKLETAVDGSIKTDGTAGASGSIGLIGSF